MLLDENPRVDLTDEDATNLARLLCASVKKAVGERIVPASDNRKPYYNKAQKVCYMQILIILLFLSKSPFLIAFSLDEYVFLLSC